jgi:hypothetical protein
MAAFQYRCHHVTEIEQAPAASARGVHRGKKCRYFANSQREFWIAAGLFCLTLTLVEELEPNDRDLPSHQHGPQVTLAA